MPTNSRKPRLSPAALTLAAAGVSVRELSRRLDLHPANVSRQLSGVTTQRHPELIPAIAELAGTDVATQVVAVLAADANQ